MPDVITNHLDIWTASSTKKTTVGRGSKGKQTAYGIKKLRELILELAVRGKLVPQDPNDEPASVLLEKIAEEKARLLKKGKIKKQKFLTEVAKDEMPFELPRGWRWVRLQELSTYVQRGKGPKYADMGSAQVVSQKCVQWSGFDVSKTRYVEDGSLGKYQQERFLLKNDLLWNSTGTGTVGRVTVLPEIEPRILVADSHVTVIRPLLVSSRFICNYLAAPGIQLRIAPEHENSLVSGSTQQVELNTSSVTPLTIPLPPLAEQHRIVAKVDELMALCDQLEQEQNECSATHQSLLKTLLGTLTTVENSEAFSEAWQRIAKHFDTLFTTEQSIDQLKQTLLQLAVMGKLVPQDPRDEPAGVLLRKVDLERENFIRDGKTKKYKYQQVSPNKNGLFPLPKQWSWISLGKILVFGPRNGFSPKSVEYPTRVKSLTLSAITRGHFDSGKFKYLDIEVEDESYLWLQPGDILIQRANSLEYVGVSAIFEGETHKYIYPDLIMKMRVSSEVEVKYLHLVLSNPYARDYMRERATGTSGSMPKINQQTVNSVPIPIPPKKEQHRIVAKVDQLMALCDQLKTRLQQAQTLQKDLADALVEQAIA